LTLALCESRHAYPEWITGSIFPEKILDPTDISAMDDIYYEQLKLCLLCIILIQKPTRIILNPLERMNFIPYYMKGDICNEN